MKRAGLSAGLYLLLVFLSGVAVGGFALRLYMMNTVLAGQSPNKPDDVRRDLLKEMRTRLSLSEQQLSQLTAILDTTRARYHEVKARWDAQAKEAARPELKAIQAEQVQQVKSILTEPQRVEYEKLRAEREKRHQQNKAKAAAAAASR
jgi:hypothetical protein